MEIKWINKNTATPKKAEKKRINNKWNKQDTKSKTLGFNPSMCVCMHVKLLQSCPTLRDPMDCSPPCSSVHGLLQARILECVGISLSRGSSRSGIEPVSPATPALQMYYFTTEPPRKPNPSIPIVKTNINNSTPEVSTLQPSAQAQPAACFCKISFIGTQSCP